MIDGTPSHVAFGLPSSLENPEVKVENYREGFADWLENGLRTYYGDKTLEGDCSGFGGFERIISNFTNTGNAEGEYVPRLFWTSREGEPVDMYLKDGIKYVYDNFIPQEAQPRFREAVGDVLLRLVNNEGEISNEDLLAAKKIMYLIVDLDAYESVEAIADAINSVHLTDEQRGTLQFIGRATLGSMVDDQSQRTRDALLKLVKSPYFDERSLFSIVEYLIQCDPLNALEVLEDYESRLLELKEVAKASGNDLKWIALWLKSIQRQDVDPRVLEIATRIANE